MKLLVINSNTNADMTAALLKAANSVAAADTRVEAVRAAWGVETVEGAYDAAFAALATIDQLRLHESEYDAFIVACYSDPGLYACRELTEKPVLGIAQSSMLAAAALGHRFSILSPLPGMRPILENLVRLYGMEALCASVRTVDMDVLGSFGSREKSNEAFANEGRLAIERDGAELLCLGGAFFAGRDHEISLLTGVPCVDGLSSAVKLAEMYVSLGYPTSKIRLYREPLPKTRTISEILW